MAKNTSRAVVMGFFVGILLTHPSTCHFITSTATSPTNSSTQSITNFLNFCTGAISDISAITGQIVTYLDLTLAIFCFLLICGSFGTLVILGKYGTNSFQNLLSRIPNWSIYALLPQIVLGLALGMELFVILSLNFHPIMPLACARWLLNKHAMICWRLRIMVFPMQVLISDLLEVIFDNMIGDAVISILVGIWDTFCHWKRQGHGGMLQVLVLIPSLVLAMSVNMVMYFMFFLPVTGLATIWDLFFAELVEVADEDSSECWSEMGMNGAGNGKYTPSLCMSEDISDLDLDDDGTDSDPDSGGYASFAGEEKTTSP